MGQVILAIYFITMIILDIVAIIGLIVGIIYFISEMILKRKDNKNAR